MVINKTVKIVIIIILLITVFFGVYLYLLFNRISPKSSEAKAIRGNFKINWEGRLNILLLGCDTRTTLNMGTRSDTMIIANVDLGNRKIKLLSIPRDLRVMVPGHDFDKVNSTINAAYFQDGGIALTLKTIETLLGIPVKLYAEVDFQAFKKVVDAIGGIRFDVEKDMYYFDPTDNTLINLKQGDQILDGERALQYVRFRHDEQGDFAVDSEGKVYGRVSRQTKFMIELVKKLSEYKNVLKINNLINIFSNYAETNLSSSEMLKLAILFKNFSVTKDIEILNMPSNNDFIDGISYVIPKEKELRDLVINNLVDEATKNKMENEKNEP
jgi:polyisoprenyl-teichoic acid--peptidoglycan teichoic acid transferase